MYYSHTYRLLLYDNFLKISGINYRNNVVNGRLGGFTAMSNVPVSIHLDFLWLADFDPIHAMISGLSINNNPGGNDDLKPGGDGAGFVLMITALLFAPG
jgi:hypothetical protein